MKIILKFFQKIFFSTKSRHEVQNTLNDEEELKIAVRRTVLNVFRQNLKSDDNLHTSDIGRILSIQDEDVIPISFNHPKIKIIIDEYNKQFFSLFQLDQHSFSVEFDHQNLIVYVNDKDFAIELARSNNLSLAYEYVLLRLIQNTVKEFRSTRCRIFLRTPDSVKQHKEHIEALAYKLAKKVQKTGQKLTVSAKSSYERSLIHQIIAEFPEITSKSIGEHNQRHLIIYPVRTHSENSTLTSSIKTFHE